MKLFSNREKTIKKKHSRSYEEDNDNSINLERDGKRIKLDNLLLGLSLDEGINKTPSNKLTHSFIESKSPNQLLQSNYVINPNIKLKPYSVFKKSTSPSLPNNVPSINSYVAERLLKHFHTIYDSKSSLIRWYKPYFLILYHFHNWVLRLFNRFIRKYNKKFSGKPIRGFNLYSRIMDLINLKDINFTYDDLSNILAQENKLEALKINKRINERNNRKTGNIEIIDEDNIDYEKIRYNYWDSLQGVNKDLEMIDNLASDEQSLEKSPKLYEIESRYQDLQENSGLDMEIEDFW